MVRFVPAEQLKIQYDIFGHFYSVEITRKVVITCRSVLEIMAKTHTPKNVDLISKRKPDAVFVMMNPGSSRPLVEVNNHIGVDKIHELPISLVPTKPDTTQYQLMRLMSHCEWRHVRVLNLSDLRCSQSIEFFKQFKRLEKLHSFESHSVFCDKRREELVSKMSHANIPLVRAWGVSTNLDPLIKRYEGCTIHRKTIKGLLKTGTTNKYLHPLPSLQTQKAEWVVRMIQNCLDDARDKKG